MMKIVWQFRIHPHLNPFNNFILPQEFDNVSINYEICEIKNSFLFSKISGRNKK